MATSPSALRRADGMQWQGGNAEVDAAITNDALTVVGESPPK
jgi:hypothetical protein